MSTAEPTYDSEERVTVVNGIPFDDVTFARLCELCEEAKAPMQSVIASIVAGVLEDDANAHSEEPGIVRPDSNHDLH